MMHFSVCSSAVPLPDRDADSEEALNGAAVDVYMNVRRQVGFLHYPQEEETLVSLLDQDRNW